MTLATTTRHGRHAAAYVAAVADSARPSARSNLRRAASIAAGHAADWDRFPWHKADSATLEAVRNGLAASFRPSTANATLAAVRAVLRRAWQAGDLSRADYERRRDAIRSVKGSAAPGRVLTVQAVRALFRAAADGPPATAARDAALLALLYGAGLRRAEAAAADLGDLDRDAWTLTVRGKGRRERVAYLNNGARDALAAWLAVRGGAPGPLFAPVNKAGRVAAGSGISGHSVAARVRRLGERAGLGPVSPHALRRSFATVLLAQGNDLAVTADLMGHANVNTTRRYDRRGQEAAAAAAATIAVPFTA